MVALACCCCCSFYSWSGGVPTIDNSLHSGSVSIYEDDPGIKWFFNPSAYYPHCGFPDHVEFDTFSEAQSAARGYLNDGNVQIEALYYFNQFNPVPEITYIDFVHEHSIDGVLLSITCVIGYYRG